MPELDNLAPGRADTTRPEDTIAGTGPGIPDDALAPGETLPEPPGKAEVAAIARALDAPVLAKD